MPAITTQAEIAASPETVRAKFLDFSKIPEYHPNGFIASIAPAAPKPATEIAPGDVMNCVVSHGNMKMSPTVLENSTSAFIWRGALPGLFVGDHAFRFEPSKTKQNGTLFIHEENFSGILSFLMGENAVAGWAGWAQKTRTGFEGFTKDFKAWCETA